MTRRSELLWDVLVDIVQTAWRLVGAICRFALLCLAALLQAVEHWRQRRGHSDNAVWKNVPGAEAGLGASAPRPLHSDEVVAGPPACRSGQGLAIPAETEHLRDRVSSLWR